MNQELDWLYDLKDEVETFLSHQQNSIKKGYYPYSYSGDIYGESIHWNLGSSVFGLKLYYLLGINKNQDIIDTANYIKSFQNKDKIYDHFIYKKEQGGFNFFLNNTNTRYYRAKITKGQNEAYVHGTVLFMWGISIIIQILGLENEFYFREFLT